MAMTAAELATAIGATVSGDGALEIRAANTLEAAGPGDVSFLANPKYMRQLHHTKATAVIAAPGVGASHVTLLHSANPYFAFTQAMVLLHGYRKHPFAGVHPKAHVEPTATVGEGTVIYPGAFVGPRAKIGRDCILFAGVAVYDDCVLGDRVTLHANTVIGTDGYGYATYKGVHHKIPQVGNVVVGDDVEIGSNCSIARATMGSTLIGEGTKINDNVAIGHNVKLGAHGLVVSQTGIAGSTTIGHHVIIAGQVAITGHLKIGDNVVILGRSAVTDDVPDQSTMMGTPALPASKGRRVMVAGMQLPEMMKRIQELEHQVAELATEKEK